MWGLLLKDKRKPNRLISVRLFVVYIFFMKDFINAIGMHVFGNIGPEQVRRADICGGCDKKTFGGFPLIIESKMKDVNGFKCSECNCPLATKIFAQDEKNICDKWKM